jgi:hypothetical protein
LEQGVTGSTDGFIKITQTGAGAGETDEVTVKVQAFNPTSPTRGTLNGFIEADGYVSIEAEHFTRKVDAGQIRWEKIEDYGRTLSSMTAFPVTTQSVTPPQNSPCLEYRMYLFQAGKAEVETIIAPSWTSFRDARCASRSPLTIRRSRLLRCRGKHNAAGPTL